MEVYDDGEDGADVATNADDDGLVNDVAHCGAAKRQ